MSIPLKACSLFNQTNNKLYQINNNEKNSQFHSCSICIIENSCLYLRCFMSFQLKIQQLQQTLEAAKQQDLAFQKRQALIRKALQHVLAQHIHVIHYLTG